MPLVIYGGKLLTRDGKLASDAACCCGEPPPPPEFKCCCVGESPVLNTSDYRRITTIPYEDTCEGTELEYPPPQSQNACTDRSIIASWCGMEVELTYPGSYVGETIDPQTDTGACGIIYSQSLEIISLPPGNFQSPSGWNQECGRCVFRFLVVIQQTTFECGSETKQYFIDFREGCDSDVHVELWVAGSDEAMYTCDDAPVVTTTVDP